MLRFQFDEKKGVETLAFIAQSWPEITPFFAAKVLFFAEKMHLNRYSRPIVGDTFIAMPNGPVPSTIYDFIKGKLDQAGDPEAIVGAIKVDDSRYKRVTALREPDLRVLSESDVECLSEAIEFCRGKSFGHLSTLTHQEKAWIEASANTAMDYGYLFEGDEHGEKLEEAREFSVYGVM